MNEATTIDEVIDILQAYIDQCYDKNSRMGYFASLYTRVTIAVKEAMDQGYFADNLRMERLDVNFANYLIRSFTKPSPVWQAVFDAAQNPKPVIFQQMLLGMNAHINYDLALATFDTQHDSGEPFNAIHSDYTKINDILIRQIDIVQELINRSWWGYRLLDKLFLRFDEKYVGFRIIKARASAWDFAKELSEGRSIDEIKKMMQALTFRYQNDIINPSWIFKLVIWVNRLFESKSVKKNITLLRPPRN